MANRDVKIALGQIKVEQGNTKTNIDKILKMIEDAAKQNVDIICFPELANTGYFLNSEDFQKLAETSNGTFIQLL